MRSQNSHLVPIALLFLLIIILPCILATSGTRKKSSGGTRGGDVDKYKSAGTSRRPSGEREKSGHKKKSGGRKDEKDDLEKGDGEKYTRKREEGPSTRRQSAERRSELSKGRPKSSDGRRHGKQTTAAGSGIYEHRLRNSGKRSRDVRSKSTGTREGRRNSKTMRDKSQKEGQKRKSSGRPGSSSQRGRSLTREDSRRKTRSQTRESSQGHRGNKSRGRSAFADRKRSGQRSRSETRERKSTGGRPSPAASSSRTSSIRTRSQSLRERSASISESDFRKTSKCNLIWTAFLPGKCAFYTFSGQFGEHRMKQLRDIVQKGGSVQSNDALEYEEFKAMEKGQFDASMVRAFQKQVEALDKAIANFYKKHLPDDKMPSMGTLADGMAKSKENVLKLLMECKLFMHHQMLEGAPGAWLHFHSFIQSRSYSRLRAIHECSSLQSPELDRMINAAIYEEHHSNRPRQSQRRPYNRTIVEGAGPVGLYSAIKFFMAGSNVLCVNDRTEYTRNRAIFFDQRWMHQLRFLLGTEFDNLFTADRAPGQINMPEYVGQTNINEVEKSLMRRLQSLERFVDKKLGNGQDRLNLRFGQRLVRVDGPERTSRSRQNFHNAIIEGPKKNVKPMNTAVDLLVCAGGANDRIRDEYIGPAIRRSETKYYGVVVFVKRQFGRSIFPDLTVFYDANLVDFAPLLRDYHFDEYIDEYRNLFSKEFGTKYAEFTKQLAKMEGQKLIIRLFENKITVHIASITPALADTFFADLSQEERAVNSERQQARIKQFRQQIEQKWAAALFRLTLAHSNSKGLMPLERELLGANLPDGRVQFDEHPVNTTNFPLTIRAIQDAVSLIGNNAKDDGIDAKTIAIAVGDANTSPHFMTASGVSTGRMGVELAARLLREYHRGDIRTQRELINGLRRELNSIQERVLQKIAQEVGHFRLLDTPPPQLLHRSTSGGDGGASSSSAGTGRKNSDRKKSTSRRKSTSSRG